MISGRVPRIIAILNFAVISGSSSLGMIRVGELNRFTIVVRNFFVGFAIVTFWWLSLCKK
jgi:hypothetical protein